MYSIHRRSRSSPKMPVRQGPKCVGPGRSRRVLHRTTDREESMKLPMRSTMVIIALVFGYAACGNNEPEDVDLVHQAIGPDQTTPIGQKWKKLAAAGIALGDTTSAVQTIPGGAGQYQTFVNGVI